METLASILKQHAAARPDAIALVYGTRLTTYSQLLDRAGQVCAGLQAMGVKPGERIAFLGKNSDAYFELWIGAILCGAVMVPINWRLSEREIQGILVDSEARVVFVDYEAEKIIRTSSKNIPAVILIDESSESQSYYAWRDGFSPGNAVHRASDTDIALQVYTSGTTGAPKGVMLTHVNLLLPRKIQQRAGVPWEQWAADDASLISMPVSHISGSGWFTYSLYSGARGIITRDFDPETILELIQSQGITHLFLVPAALRLLIQHPKAQALSHRLKFVLYGGAPMPVDLLRGVMGTLGCGMVQLYGMTETTGCVTALPPSDHVLTESTRMLSAGRVVAGVEVAILAPGGTRVPNGQIGEIVVKGHGVMAGYWRNPEATAAVIGEDGWLRTGDLGDIDADGYLTIRDRLKDMIISGGENIFAAEIENLLTEHPDVAEAAVIGVPDPHWGEVVKAVIVRRAGSSLNPADLIVWASGRIARYKVPKYVAFTEALPRNAAGKVLKRELRKWSDNSNKSN
jgi:long-chain acyl-CoA synthetase